MNKFWMVLRDGETYIKMRHTDRESARSEARRLAEANPGAKFFVLEALTFVEKIEIREEELSEPKKDVRPF